jgi:hypothetical protein
MNPVFKKLNYKSQDPIYIINSPDSFQKEVEEVGSAVKTSLTGAKSVTFFIGFVTKQKEVDELTKKVAPLIDGDGVLWFAYPKGTSKKYKCEFNRDNGWAELGKKGFEPVRMVAIDEDWSALRFRKAEHIKSMTRSFAMSDEGKKKVSARKAAKSVGKKS